MAWLLPLKVAILDDFHLPLFQVLFSCFTLFSFSYFVRQDFSNIELRKSARHQTQPAEVFKFVWILQTRKEIYFGYPDVNFSSADWIK